MVLEVLPGNKDVMSLALTIMKVSYLGFSFGCNDLTGGPIFAFEITLSVLFLFYFLTIFIN